MTSIFSNPIFILDALRTPIGSPYKNFKDLTAAQLAALAFQKLYSHQNFKKDLISEMILGNTVSAGTGQNLARQAALGAGLAETIPVYTVNNVCGAGLQAVILGAQAILAGAADIVLTGGAIAMVIEKLDSEQWKKA